MIADACEGQFLVLFLRHVPSHMATRPSNNPMINACTAMSSQIPGIEGGAPARMIGIEFQSRLAAAPTMKPMMKFTGPRDIGRL